MAVSDRFKARFDSEIISYQVKVFIEDSGDKNTSTGAYTRVPTWTDFSDRIEASGKNLIKKIGTISHVTEGRAGASISFGKLSTITLDNSDRFFNAPFPSTLKTIYGDTANFDESKRAKITPLFHHKLQVRLLVTFQDNSVEEGTLGTFLISNMKKSNVNSDVVLSLTDLSQPLREKNGAERVKDGFSWWQNKPVKFLLEELLRDRYWDKSDTLGNLPTTYKIPNRIPIPTSGTKLGSSGDNRGMSTISRPPDMDVYDNRAMITRSMVYVPSTSSNLTSGLYLGCDNTSQAEVWRYDRDDDDYTRVQNAGSDWYLSDYFIWRMWYDSSLDVIIFVTISKTSVDNENTRNATAYIYKYNGTNITAISSSFNIFMGDYCFREGTTSTMDWGGDTKNNRSIGYMSATGTHYGENIPIPFKQKIISVGMNAASVAHQSGVVAQQTTITGEMPDIYYEGLDREIDGQRYAAVTAVRDSVNPPCLGLRFTLGQSGFCVYNQEHGRIVFARITESGADATRTYAQITSGIYVFDVGSQEELTAIDSNFTENSKRVDVLCGCSGGPTNYQKDYVFIGAVAWYDEAGATRSRTYLYNVNLSTNTKTKIYDSNSDPSRGESFTPVWMAWNDYSTLTPIKIISLNRDKIGSNNLYTIMSHPTTSQNAFNLFYEKRNFQHLPQALTFDSNGIMYFFSNGQLYKYYVWDGTRDSNIIERPILMDDGYVAVQDEIHIACDSLGIDEEAYGTEDNAVIYAISSPVPSTYNLLTAESSGKFYLFQCAEYLSDRIELADFEGMSRWDAIEKLAMISGHHAGFDVEGNFIFISDTQSSAADLTIENSSSYRRISAIDIESNEKEIYNFVQISPYRTELEEPTAESTLIPRPDLEGKEMTKGTIIVTQLDTRKKRVELKCLTDGMIGQGIPIHFSYRSMGERFETSLRRAGTIGDTTIRIRSGIDNVDKGDKIIIISEVDGVEQNEEFTVESDPTASEKESGIVNIHDEEDDEGLVYNHPVNSYVEVNKFYNEWSDKVDNVIENSSFELWDRAYGKPQLINYTNTSSSADHVMMHANYYVSISQYFYNTPFVTGGKSVIISAINTTGWEGIYQTIPATKLAGGTDYSVSCYVRVHAGDKYVAKSQFKLQVKEGEVKVGMEPNTYAELPNLSGWTDQILTIPSEEFTKIEGTFTTPGSQSDTYSTDITIGLLTRKDPNAISGGRASSLVDDIIVKKGRVAPPVHLIAEELDYKYLIGDTKIQIIFQSGKPMFSWATGDRILIDCPGLVLKKQDQNINTSLDAVSIGIYDKREFPSIDNKFINWHMADQLTRRLLEDYKYPHYKMQITLPLMPYLNFVNDDGLLYRVDVYDKDLFQLSGEWKEQCYIQGISHDVARGITILTLRAINAY